MQIDTSQNPVGLMLKALLLSLSGRVRIGKELENENLSEGGEDFLAFRKIEVRPGPSQPSCPAVVFQIRFTFKNLSSAANRRLSAIPTPLIVAQPGFRSKTWLMGKETGDFVGRYEFDTAEAAEAYLHSLPLRLMRRRAAPGSITHSISRV
jgi:hypothetical protein